MDSLPVCLWWTKWTKHWGNFEFDPSSFPNPKEMVDELHAKGFKVMVWVSPFISPDSKEFKHLAKK
jgi:alpha-glucosidase